MISSQMNEQVENKLSNVDGALAVSPTPRKTIFDLPNELLSKIFAAGPDVSQRRPNQLPFPLLVSLVNSHWRSLAQHTPELWTVIIPPLHKREQVCIAFASLWLKRSGALLVTIILDARVAEQGSRYDAGRLISAVFDHIVGVAYSRLRQLDIWSGQSWKNHHPAIALSLLRHAPQLQQVSVCFNDWSDPRDDRTISVEPCSKDWNWLLSLPRLGKLRWSGLKVPLIPNLTSLNAHYLSLSYQDVRTLFSTSPNLTHLILDGIRPLARPIPHGHATIQANSLRSLAIRRLVPLQPGDIYIFHLLSIPNLEYLELGCVLNVSSIFGSSITPESIKTLRILNMPTAPLDRYGQTDADLTFFYSFSNLRDLQIVRVPTWGLLANLTYVHRAHAARTPWAASAVNVNSAFTPRAGPPKTMPWPNLHTIALDSDSAIDVTCLCEFVVLHEGVKQAQLSESAMQHLSGTIRRQGTTFSHLNSNGADQGAKDAKEWLAERVDLRVLPDDDHGILDTGFPLSELP